MAVALRQQEFQSIGGFFSGDLSGQFDIKGGYAAYAEEQAANAPFLLRLVQNNVGAEVNGLGHTLDTVERVQDYATSGRQQEHDDTLLKTVIGYNIDEISREPTGKFGPGPDDKDFSTDAGYRKVTAAPEGQVQSEELERQRDFQFFMLMESIRDDNQYLLELEQKIREIDERLSALKKEQDALLETEEFLLANPSLDLNSPQNKNRLRTMLGKHGLKLEDYMDDHGNVDRDRLKQALQEQKEQQRLEEEELRRQRDEYEQRLQEYKRSRDNSPEAVQRETAARREFLSEQLSMPVPSGSAAPSVSTETIEKAAALDLDAVLAIGFSAPQKPEAAPETKLPVDRVSLSPSTTPEIKEAPPVIVVAGPRALGSFAAEMDTENTGTSSKIIQLTTKFSYASNPVAETDVASVASLTHQPPQNNTKAFVL